MLSCDNFQTHMKQIGLSKMEYTNKTLQINQKIKNEC